ncbi:PspC domain-containing protein [Lysobacter korlensis]|uniref:PspC domain-containing protein n=1 Tax=Lysobacter korlensis TaxID=553636 RepID=A0ABV6S0Q7_9GAMM
MATPAGDDPTTQQTLPPDGGPTAPGATPAAPSAPSGNRFFDWLRGLGLVRTRGWIGGVAAGIGARLGIDPLLVRGILVVIAVLGGPVVLLYAAAWLLLPDEHDVIHAEELGRGRFSPAIAGIGTLVLLSLLPLNQGFWNLGALYWGAPQVDFPFGRLFWTAVLIAAVVLFVIWVARRSSDTATPPGAPTTATTGDAQAATPTAASAADRTWAATAPAAFAPQPPPAAASADELAAWRAQQDEWQRQRAAWAAEQKRTDREVAQAAAREKARRNAEAAIERARIRKLTRPRTSAAFVGIAVGAAIVAGALAALLAGTGTGGDATVGFAVALLVLGAAIVLAGALRRRSAFLSFLGFVALVALLVSLVAPGGRQLLFPGYYGVDTTRSGSYAMPAGELSLYVWDDGDDTVAEVDLWQAAGQVDIAITDGQTVRVDFETDRRSDVVHTVQDLTTGAESDRETIATTRDGRRIEGALTAGAPGVPDVVVTIWQGAGSITVRELTETEQ